MATIPEGAANVRHGRLLCRLLNHSGLEWTSGEEPVNESGSVRRLFVANARCSDCGRAQPRLRVVFPRDHWIKTDGPHVDA